MQLENIKELLYRSENSKEKIAESDTKIRDKEEYVEEMEEPPQFFRRKKRRKRTGSGSLQPGVQWGFCSCLEFSFSAIWDIFRKFQ